MVETQLAAANHAAFSVSGDGRFIRAFGVPSIGRGIGLLQIGLGGYVVGRTVEKNALQIKSSLNNKRG